MSALCAWCGARTTGHTGLCRTCKSLRYHACKRVEREELLVEEVSGGGGWWVWSARGDVLVIGRETKGEAVRALARGEGLS